MGRKMRIFRDGNQWCVLQGKDLVTGKATFGLTKHEAITRFYQSFILGRLGDSGEEMNRLSIEMHRMTFDLIKLLEGKLTRLTPRALQETLEDCLDSEIHEKSHCYQPHHEDLLDIITALAAKQA
jgi:hypothetical protein